jgi:hypothetical protein
MMYRCANDRWAYCHNNEEMDKKLAEYKSIEGNTDRFPNYMEGNNLHCDKNPKECGFYKTFTEETKPLFDQFDKFPKVKKQEKKR